MDENLSRGYIQLGKHRAAHDYRFNDDFKRRAPPRDEYNAIYISLVFAGAGFLLPYNSFTIAADYFQSQYPESTIVFDISLIYIVMAFFAVLANNILVETLPLNMRIAFGYIISFSTLLFVIVFAEASWERFGPNTAYFFTLLAVAIVSLGCTVQQSSFYGYTSMLPSRYTQAVMAGESAAGLIITMNRILTKLLVDDQKLNTISFFLISTLLIALCYVLHTNIHKTQFIQFYIAQCEELKKITLEPKEDIGLMDPKEPSDSAKSQYGELKFHTNSNGGSSSDYSAGQYSSLSFANPVYEPRSSGPSYRVEDIVLQIGNSRRRSTGRWKGLRRGFLYRWEVAKCIWPYMLTIGLAYFVTLCLYPGIESEIVSCNLGSWMPVIVMTIFNASDLAGKILASYIHNWSRTNMLVFAGCRVLLIPLILLCAMPRGHPYISGDTYPMIFSFLLGLTNGLIGSIPMMQAPSKVPEENRELTGNIMTLSYNTGLTAGCLGAYLLDAMLGKKSGNSCESITPTVSSLTTLNSSLATSGVVPSANPFVSTTTMLLTTASPTNATTATLTSVVSLLTSTLPTFTNLSAN